ncbi:MAG: AI-2E family transporter [Micropruina glycogenica]
MVAQPDEVGDAPGDGGTEPTPQAAAAPRPAATPSGPRGWLHRMRRITQPTPADPDPDAVGAGPRHEVTLGRRSPFAIGFFITLGALTAFGLVFGLYRISYVVLLVMLALYLALGLNPLVDRLSSTGLRRGFSVFLVALGALAVLALAFWAVLPVAYEQINRLLLNAPSLLQELRANPQIAELDARYDVINRVSNFLTSGELLSGLFGGLWGPGRRWRPGVQHHDDDHADALHSGVDAHLHRCDAGVGACVSAAAGALPDQRCSAASAGTSRACSSSSPAPPRWRFCF